MSGADASSRSDLPAPEYSSGWAAAEAALQAGDLVAARDHATGIAARSRGRGMERRHGRAQRLLGQIAWASGDVEPAERAFRAALLEFTVLEDTHAAAGVLTDLAEVRLHAGDFGGATDLARQAAERVPGDVRALTALGQALWLGGSPADAASTFEQALDLDRAAVAALIGRGQIHADLGHNRAAMRDLDRALALGMSRDEEADVRSARALALAGLGDPHGAEEELACALALDPFRVRTRLRRARIRALTGEIEQARAELEEILTLDATPVELATAGRTLARLRAR